jgi:hypothetical protein
MFLTNDNSGIASVSKAKGNTFDDEKKMKVITIIQDNRELWGRILKFQELDLKEVKDLLNTKNVIVESNALKDFLTQKGVHFK